MITSERSERAKIFALLCLIRMIPRDLKILMGQLDILSVEYCHSFCNPHDMALIKRLDIHRVRLCLICEGRNADSKR